MATVATLALVCGCAPAGSDATNADGSAEEALKGGRFTRLKSGPTNAHLKAVYDAAKALDDEYLGAYRFNKPGPEAKDALARENRIKETMHRYMCGYFDEAIGLERYTGAKRVERTLTDLDVDDNVFVDDPDAKIETFTKAVAEAFTDPSLDIMSGEASGNNTFGQIMGVYDTQKNEILFFGFTNCGSDN